MALTDPYPAEIETLLQDPIQHLFEVRILPASGASYQVAVVGRLDLTFDMDWSPMAQVSLTIKTPSDPDQVAVLDPRLGTRVQIKAGYRVAGTNHLPVVAVLRLHSTNAPHPGGTTDITAHGSELVLQNLHAPVETETSSDGYPVKTGVDAFVKSWIKRGWEPYGPYPSVVSTISGGSWGLGLVSDWKSSGNTYWDAVDEVCKSAGIRVYDDGLGTWRIEYLPALGTSYAARFRDGKRGTITSFEASADREGWYNDVLLQYDYVNTSGSPATVVGVARVTSGPLAAVPGNTRQYFRHYTTPWTMSLTAAKARADGLLRKFMLRGRERSFTAAAAYWLRPGQTILVKIGRQKYDRVLVAAVTFSPLTGSMAVRTVRPEDYETE